MTQWCTTWLHAYRTRKPSTVQMAGVHIAKIVAAFGPSRLDSLRPTADSVMAGRTQGSRATRIPTSTPCTPGWRKSCPTRCMTGVLGVPGPLGVRHRVPVSHGLTWPPRARYGRCTMRWNERYRAGLLLAAFAGLRLAEVFRVFRFLRGLHSGHREDRCSSTRPRNSRRRPRVRRCLFRRLGARAVPARRTVQYRVGDV